MRRAALLFLVFMALGALANLAVAWACAAWVNPFQRAVHDARRLVTGEWLCTFETSGLGHVRFAQTISDVHFTDDGRTLVNNTMSPGTLDDRCLVIDESGWPARSMSCTTKDIILIDTGHLLMTLRSKSPPRINRGILLSTTFNTARPDAWRALPLRPLWIGTMINTAFYALIGWVAWRGQRAARRALRRRRGLCAACGYDLRGHSEAITVELDAGRIVVCPECGCGK